MLNTTKAFIFSLFELFIVYIVFGNFLGWSGGAPNVTGYSYDWSNSYIGFQSLFIMVDDFNESVNAITYRGNSLTSMSAFLGYVTNLTNVITLGIPKLITAIQNNDLNILNIGEFLLNLLAQPIMLVAWSAVTLGVVLYWIICFIGVFLRFCGGAYNITMYDTSDAWSQWDSVISSWSWNVPVV